MATTDMEHKDLLNTQDRDYLEKAFEVAGRKDSFWGGYIRKVSVPAGYSSYKYNKLVLKDPTALNEIVEGVAQVPTEKLNFVQFTKSLKSYYHVIEYTRQMVDDSWNDTKLAMLDQLKESNRWDLDHLRGNAYIGGTYVVSAAITIDTLQDQFLKARTRLKKNNARPCFGQKYLAIVPDEVANAILVKFADSLTHTSQNEALVQGYIGELFGFVITSSTDDAIYKTIDTATPANSVGYILFIGKSDAGWPVVESAVGAANMNLIQKALGSSGTADPIDEHGSMATRLDKVGEVIANDECIIRGEFTLTPVTADVPGAYKTPAANVVSGSDQTTPAN